MLTCTDYLLIESRENEIFNFILFFYRSYTKNFRYDEKQAKEKVKERSSRVIEFAQSKLIVYGRIRSMENL